MEEILSPDEASCNSSHVSNKSEKNMADFEGEDVLSDDELAHINAHANVHGHTTNTHLSSHTTHMQQHLAHMAATYRKRRPTGL